MRRRCAPVALLLALVAVAPNAAAQAIPRSGFTAEEEAYLDARGPIRVAMTEFAPWTFTAEHGDPAGISIDIMRLMRVKTGLEFDFVKVPGVAAALDAVRAGEADVHAALATGAGREDLLFGEAYAVNGIQAWGPASSSALADRDFAGARVAVVRNGTQAPVLASRYPAAIPVPVSTQADGLAALARKDADAFLGLQASILYISRAQPSLEIVPLTPVLSTVTVHFAVDGGDALLASVMSKALARIEPDERRGIFMRWTGADLSVPEPAAPTVPLRLVGFGLIALAAAAVGIGVPIWIATLRTRVADRTREIETLNESLERRVTERTRALEASTSEMESFAYSVSHDLRAPLRAIDGFTHSVLTEHADGLRDDARADLARVRAGSQRMGALIDDLLLLSRTGRRELAPEDTDVTAMADAVMHNLRVRDPARKVEFIVGAGLRAHADPRLLEVVIASLLDNAWKFTGGRARARIEFGRASTPRGDAFFVRDDGVGFQPEFVGKLFTPFQRLHAADEFPGTGIGLASARRIVERHGGEVWAEGAPGKGATFYFTLPGDRATPGGGHGRA